MKKLTVALVSSAVMLGLTADASAADKNKRGTQAMDLDPTSRGAISGTGFESRDIDAMADMVLRDLMSRPDFVSSPQPPRICMDSELFYNNSSQRIDRDMITGSLRAALNRGANGKLRFVNREQIAAVMRERELKRTGVANVGTRGMTQGISGLDFQLVGKITSLDSRDSRTGITQRRMQVIFELMDMETGDLMWTSEPFVTLRASGDDVVYR
ncbi:MAG: CsgG/HfaB family protein [Sphingobium sp.]